VQRAEQPRVRARDARRSGGDAAPEGDSCTRERLQKQLAEIWQETGEAIVCIAHNIAEAFVADETW
jgi:hypothetical protein